MQFTKIDRDTAIRKMEAADQRIEALAKRHAQDTGVTIAKAYEAVLQTQEGRKLYAEYTQAHYAL